MKVSEWLSENIDSHTVYEVELLAELPEPVSYDPVTDKLSANGKSVTLFSRTAGDMLEREGAAQTGDPKGFYPGMAFDPNVRAVPGYGLSATLDMLLTGADGGATYMGRGTAHRARIAHIAAAGF